MRLGGGFIATAKETIVIIRTLLCAALLCAPAVVSAQAAKPAPAAPAPAATSQIPHLRKQGTATQLIVDGKPFLALAGELSNSSGSSVEYMKMVWPRLAAAKINTVLAAVPWNQVEPVEGKFDFTVLDGLVQGARAHNLRLVLLWFGSWKNSMSSYAPDWVKENFGRFPRAVGPGGKTMELLTPFNDANRDADVRAFTALMRHVKLVDGHDHTVIMIQVENEVGMHDDTRDRSPMANQAYAGQVPKELMDYLQDHKDGLIPEFRKAWEAAGFKSSGTWEEVFGKGATTEGIFMAWAYARYMDRIAEAGKKEYPLPMFANAALYDPSKGFAPSGGRPWDLVQDVWKAGAPRIDMLSPDIYDQQNYVTFCAKFSQNGNPLFIPETRYQMEARTLFAFGRYDAIGITLMGVERAGNPDPEMLLGHEIIRQLAPLISKHQGDGTMSAVLLKPDDAPQKVRVGDYTVEVARMRQRPSAPQPQQGFLAALFIQVGPREFYVVGGNVSAVFSANTPGPPQVGVGTVEEGKFVGGRWIPSRQLAGDETGEGGRLSLRSHPVDRIVTDGYVGIQHVKLYRFE